MNPPPDPLSGHDPAEVAEALFGIELTEAQKERLRHLWNHPETLAAAQTPKSGLRLRMLIAQEDDRSKLDVER